MINLQKIFYKALSVAQLGRVWNILWLEGVVIISTASLVNNFVLLINFPLLVLLISAGFGMVAGTILDDIVDQNMDSELGLQHKCRPLVRGLISRKGAWTTWAFFATSSAILAAMLGVVPFLGSLSVLVLGLLFSYELRLKQYFLLNELTITLVFSIEMVVVSLYVSGAVASPIPLLIIFSIFSVFAARSFEGFIDYDYDLKEGKRTLQTMFGFRKSLRIILLVLLLTYAIFIVIFHNFVIKGPIFIASMIVFCAIGVLSCMKLLISYTPEGALRAYRLGRFFGLGIFWSILITSIG